MIDAYVLYTALVRYIQPMVSDEISYNGMTFGTTVNRNEVTIDLKPMSGDLGNYGMVTVDMPKRGYWLRLDARRGVAPKPDANNKTNEDCWMIEQSIMSMTFTKAARFNRIYIFDDDSVYCVPCEKESEIDSNVDRDFMHQLCDYLKGEISNG